jgi:hypothetical protein
MAVLGGATEVEFPADMPLTALRPLFDRESPFLQRCKTIPELSRPPFQKAFDAPVIRCEQRTKFVVMVGEPDMLHQLGCVRW